MFKLDPSYTAANEFPIKLFCDDELVRLLRSGVIKPWHASVVTTNKCNLECGFCSCKERDLDKEMTKQQLMDTLVLLQRAGCRAVTFTGGGEPTMHPNFDEALLWADELGLKIGLVNNGFYLKNLKNLSKLTWSRISASDDRKIVGIIRKPVLGHPEVDWAISYVLTREFDEDNLVEHLEFANYATMTHVRVVNDLIDLGNTPPLSEIKKRMEDRGVDISRVIWQDRQGYSKGAKDCFISLLKPFIGADAKIYPCCGVQYAGEIPELDLPESMCMGSIYDIPRIYENQEVFDGSKCVRCYYEGYNSSMAKLRSEIKHGEFV